MLDAKARAQELKKKLNENDDVVVREINLKKKNAYLVFLDEITDNIVINQNIINGVNTLLKDVKKINIQTVMTKLSSVDKISSTDDDKQIVDDIFRGCAILFIDGLAEAISFNVAKFESRAIAEPPTATVIKGPREGFTESIKTNIGLIRKRLLTEDLKIETMVVGRKTRTVIKVVYLDSVAKPSIVDKIIKKINAIDIDGVVDSYYIAQFLAERPNSMFRQVGSVEKPDIVVSKVLEGRVAIIVDGSPMVLTLPYLLVEELQSSNDYYTEPYRASTLRVLRIIGAMISILVPGLFIAMELYHYKLIPLKFLVTIVNSTQNLPLSPFLEIFFVLLLFEILFEASIRMPKYLGIAISIVGALILGDTAVKAGLVSSPCVMIVAISGITIYTVPEQSAQMSVLRILFTFLGGVLGFLGMLLGCVVVVIYLSNFNNYETPYLAPYAPFVKNDQQDFIMRKNITQMKKRPKSIPQKNKTRMK